MCNFQIMKKVKKCQKSPNYCKKTPNICVFLVQYKGEKITYIRVVAFFEKKIFFEKEP